MVKFLGLFLGVVFMTVLNILPTWAQDSSKVVFIHCTTSYSGTPQLWLTTEFKVIPVAGDEDVQGFCYSESKVNKHDGKNTKLISMVQSIPRAFATFMLVMDDGYFQSLLDQGNSFPDRIVAEFLGGKEHQMYTADSSFSPHYANRDNPVVDGTIMVSNPDLKKRATVPGFDVWLQIDFGNKVDGNNEIITPRRRQAYVWFTDLDPGHKLLVAFFSPIAGKEREYPNAPTTDEFRLWANETVYQTMACFEVGYCPKSAQALIVSGIVMPGEGTSVADVNP